MVESRYERRRRETLELRGEVAGNLRPLFDHLLHLAADSHSRGYYRRAGRELLHARKLARALAAPARRRRRRRIS